MEPLLIKISLLILFYNVFSPFLFKLLGLKVDLRRMNCGLVGYCGAVPANPFIIKMLLMYNEKRGEDATGWAVNNEITKDTKKVSEFLQKNKLETNETDENYTIIAHARQGSSGSKINKKLAHPFGMYKNGVEKEKYDIILAMNGTLQNDDLIAEKYGIKMVRWENSDTEVVAIAMANLGEKDYKNVLKEYEGTMNLLFFTPKIPNTLMVYKDPGRTLFAWQKEKDQMYISSMEEALLSIGAEKEKITVFEDRFLYHIKKGKVTKREKIESDPLKKKPIYSSDRRSKTTHYPSTAFSSVTKHWGSSPSFDDIINEIEKNIHENNKGNKIYPSLDRYYRNGHYVDGVFSLDEKGEIQDDQKKGKKYYFINGYMCKNKEKYDQLMRKCEDKAHNYSLNEFYRFALSELIDYFEYPAAVIVEDEGERMIIPRSWDEKSRENNGEFSYKLDFSPYIITLKYNGIFIRKTGRLACEVLRCEKEPQKLDLTTDEGQKEAIKIIKESIKDNSASDVQFHYMQMITSLKLQKTPEVQEFFYESIIKLMLDEGIIEPNVYSSFRKVEGGKRFTDPKINDEIEDCIKLLKKRFVKLEDEESAEEHEDDNWKEDFDLATTRDKIKMQRDHPTAISVEDVVESLRRSCNIYNTKTFVEDLTKGIEIEKLSTEWNDVLGTDWEQMYEGILIFLNYLGKVSDEELLKCLDLSYQELRTRSISYYKDWIAFLYKNKANIPKGALKELVNSESDFYTEDQEVMIEEEMTPEDFESNCLTNMENLTDMISDEVNAIEVVQESDWTDKVSKIHKILKNCKEQIDNEMKKVI